MGKKILIVDDNREIVSRFGEFLEREGFTVERAYDGETALRSVREQMPDLILLDIVLPKVDGYSVAKILRGTEETRSIPVIVFSQKEGMKELFAVEGITEYLVKPVNEQELLNRIRRLLEN